MTDDERADMKCGSCVWFRPSGSIREDQFTPDGKWASEEEIRTGDCRRFPPVFHPPGSVSFPMVLEREWCGEWRK